MPVCTKCQQDKEPSEFYFRKTGSRSGLDNWCKGCRTNNRREQRARNPAPSRRNSASWRQTHPIAVKAREAVQNAVRRGRLQKKPCEECGARYVHGHHDDYSKPLSVRWLCPRHHREWHDNNGPGLGLDHQTP